MYSSKRYESKVCQMRNKDSLTNRASFLFDGLLPERSFPLEFTFYSTSWFFFNLFEETNSENIAANIGNNKAMYVLTTSREI